jgi:VWFA-related protein
MFAHRPLRRLGLSGTLALAAVFVTSGSGQEQQPRPTFRTEANLVRVDVYPTIDGRAVTDLRREDLHLFEDGARQTIEQFEQITIGGDRLEPAREPNSLAESREMVGDPRTRVFALFLDTLHVDPDAARQIADSLVDLLRNIVGPDDLVAVMTPKMSAADLTFRRRNEALQRFLAQEWWGKAREEDETEFLYSVCYPPPPDPRARLRGLMAEKRREALVLDALEDLLRFFQQTREVRSGIVAVTQGWKVLGPSPVLQRAEGVVPLIIRPPTVDPRTGVITTTTDPRDGGVSATMQMCERDRLRLAWADHNLRFESLVTQAQRANVSFYPVDPFRLTVEGGSLTGPTAPLRTLAFDTDGFAIVNTNNVSALFRRMVADLGSYYLLGYRSTNDKADGRFRHIEVRTTRSDLRVRARRGYFAPLAEATTVVAGDAMRDSAEALAEARAYSLTLGTLAGLARDQPLRLNTATNWTQAGNLRLWIVGDIGPGENWTRGGEADIRVAGPSGSEVASARATMAAGVRSFRVRLTSKEPLEAGAYAVRVQLRSSSGIASSDSMTIAVPPSPRSAGILLVRRGPSTGNRDTATTDPRVRRSEQLRLEIPASNRTPPSARLLDRTGKPVAVPLTVVSVTDAEADDWHTVQITAAPLSPGDYLIEVNAAGEGSIRMLTGLRVVQ